MILPKRSLVGMSHRRTVTADDLGSEFMAKSRAWWEATKFREEIDRFTEGRIFYLYAEVSEVEMDQWMTEGEAERKKRYS